MLVSSKANKSNSMAGEALQGEPKGQEVAVSLASRNSQAKGLPIAKFLEIPLREVTEGENL